MPRLSMCKGCGKKLQPEEKFTYSSKTYCENCFKEVQRESEEYKQLIGFICENYHIDKPNGFMLKQIKSFKTEYNYSYAAMTYTLWYCHDVLGKAFDEKYGVSLIKYYYDEAKEYYSQQEKLKTQVDNLSNMKIKTKIVKHTSVNSEKNKASLINLGDLLKGGESN